MTRRQVTSAHLSTAQVAGILALARAARLADGVEPLSEHVLLHLRYDSSGPDPLSSPDLKPGRDFILAVDGKTADGETADGETADGETADGETADGETADGETADGETADGETADGETADGETADGEIAGYAYLDPPPADPESDVSGELVIHPERRRQGFGRALVGELAAQAGGHTLRLWAHGDLPAAAGLARTTGFERFRALWQMRRPLAGGLDQPVLPAGRTLRTFVPGQDEDEWLSLNGRAFAKHPEQGGWRRHDLELREREPWFDPAGFFIAERDGRMAGFHWTKVHPPGEQDGSEDPGAPPSPRSPGIGEVYVVGVDPAEQGSGLGRALTLAGLHHLRDLGLTQAMLYVDEDNVPAIRMYEALGFTRTRIDAMYRRC